MGTKTWPRPLSESFAYDVALPEPVAAEEAPATAETAAAPEPAPVKAAARTPLWTDQPPGMRTKPSAKSGAGARSNARRNAQPRAPEARRAWLHN